MHIDVCILGVSLINSTERWAADMEGGATQTI